MLGPPPAARTPIRVAFVSHEPHLRMGGQRSMVLLIEHLDRTAVLPLVICPGPGPLTDHLTALSCLVVHIPLYHIKPRTLAQVWRSSGRIRMLLRERRIDIIAPDASRDALTAGLAKLGTKTKMVWFVRQTASPRAALRRAGERGEGRARHRGRAGTLEG